jgi:hypothetical protein
VTLHHLKLFLNTEIIQFNFSVGDLKILSNVSLSNVFLRTADGVVAVGDLFARYYEIRTVLKNHGACA